MKTVIVYSTKYGFTKRCVEKLITQLDDKHARCLRVEEASNVDLNQYDSIIVGGSIYMGMLDKKMKQFCLDNKETLLSKRLGLFITCSSMGDTANEQIKNNYDSELYNHAIAKEYLGGNVDLSKASFMHRMIIKAVSKAADNGVERATDILEDRLESFANSFKSALFKG